MNNMLKIFSAVALAVVFGTGAAQAGNCNVPGQQDSTCTGVISYAYTQAPTCPPSQTQTSAPTWNGSSWVGLGCRVNNPPPPVQPPQQLSYGACILIGTDDGGNGSMNYYTCKAASAQWLITASGLSDYIFDIFLGGYYDSNGNYYADLSDNGSTPVLDCSLKQGTSTVFNCGNIVVSTIWNQGGLLGSINVKGN